MVARKTTTRKTVSRSTKSLGKKTASRKRSKKETKAFPLHRRLLLDTRFFLNDLECAKEMFDVVLPSLAQKDEERREKIEQSMVAIRKAAKASKKDKAEDLTEVVRLLVDSISKLHRADKMFRTNSIACIIARFDEYIARLLRTYFHANPEQFRSSEKSLTYQELQDLTSIGQVIDTFIDKEVDHLLRDSHVDQVKFLDARLKLGIQDHFPHWCDFVEVTERRNLFTHSGGVVTPQYLRVCKAHNCSLPKEITKGDTLRVDKEYFDNSHTCLFEMAVWLGQSAVRRLFPKKLEEADMELVQEIGFPLLLREQWEIAEKVFSFAMSLPDKLGRERDVLKKLNNLLDKSSNSHVNLFKHVPILLPARHYWKYQ